MDNLNYKYNDFFKIVSILIITLIPITLTTGPFLADFLLAILSIFFIINCYKENYWYWLKNPLFIFLLVFYFYILSRTFYLFYIFNLPLDSHIFYFRYLIYFSAISFFISRYQVILKYLGYSLIIIILFVTIDAFIQFFFNNDIFGIDKKGDRLSGVFGEELILGSYISRLILLCYFFLYGKLIFKKSSFILPLFIILTSIIIFLTGERTAFLIFCFSILIIFILQRNKIHILKSMLLIIIPIILIALLNDNSQNRMIKETLNQLGLSSTNNTSFLQSSYGKIYSSSFDLFKESPLIGVGPKNYENFCLNSKKVNSKINCGAHPHNYLIQTLTETGLLGFFIFYSFYFYLIFIFFRYCKMNKKENLIYIGSLGSIIIFYLPFLPSGNFYNGWLNTITFFNLGIFNIYFQKIIRN